MTKKSRGAAFIVGVGSGLGAALARRFAAGGLPVALGARRREPLEAIAAEIAAAGGRALVVPHDATVPEQVQASVRRVREAFGRIEVLIYNAGNVVRGDLAELSPESFEGALRTGPYGAFLYANEVVGEMEAHGRGTLLFTGATSSVMAPAHGPAFAAAKFALRGLAMSLARNLGPKGIHVAHVLLDGVIDTPLLRERGTPWETDELLDPDAIADAYWFVANQSPRSSTFELDLRTLRDDLFDN